MTGTRPFRLGLTPWTLALNDWRFDFAVEHADLIALHGVSDQLGRTIPWFPFADAGDYEVYRERLATPRYRPVLDVLDRLKVACAGRVVYLSEELLAERCRLAAPFEGEYPASFLRRGVPSFRRRAVRAAAANFARFLVDHFHPIAFSPFIEFNTARLRFAETVADEWGAVCDTYRTIYHSLKHAYPPLLVFPSWHWDLLLQDEARTRQDFRVVREVAQLDTGGTLDVFGLSSYPNSPFNFGSLDVTPESLPPDYLTRAASLLPGRPLAVSETGWYADVPRYAEQRLYIERLLDDAGKLDMRFVVHFFVEDQMYGHTRDGVREHVPLPFGLRQGAPGFEAKPALAVWDAVLRRPLLSTEAEGVAPTVPA